MKIAVVVVLVLVAVLFAVGAGAAFAKPRPDPSANPEKEAKTHRRTSFEDWLAGFSLPSGASSPLKKSVYRAGDPAETVGKADALRTVKFRLLSDDPCDIEIRFEDAAVPPDKTLGDQKTHLRRHSDEGQDKNKRETTIVLLKAGGRISFGPCLFHKTGPCPNRFEVVK